AVISVTGAISNIHVKFSDGQKTDFESYQAIALDEGDEFQIQAPTAGLRNYLAIRGGIDVQSVLNSASFDSLAILGPEPLKMGDTVYQG
ncbi:allophanate hydrolase, partial [Acinetobacter variabilis]